MLARIVVVTCLLSTAAPPARQRAVCDPPVWGDAVSTFERRVQTYVARRGKLEAGLPTLIAAGIGEISSTQRTLAARVRQSRAAARQGEFFSAALATQIRKSLRLVMDAHTWKVIMDDNPGEQPSQVNDEYRDGSPLTTMPPNVLAALPALPDGDLEYRFVERHLILLDTRARLIIDRIPFAIGDPDREESCR